MTIKSNRKEMLFKKCENEECQDIMIGILKRSGKVAPRNNCYKCVKEGKVCNVKHG